jgi:hypothetical protein
MASVQAAAPAVQHPGAPMAAGATKQQAEEMYKVGCPSYCLPMRCASEDGVGLLYFRF